MIKNGLHIVLFFLLSTNGFAQKFTASVDKNPVSKGDQFKVTFSIDANASSFKPPSFDGFYVLGGPNRSQSMSYTNGVMTNSMSYSYYLQAAKEGEFTIGAAKIKIGNKVLTSNPLKVKVVKGASVQQQQNSPKQNNQQQSESTQVSNDLFIRLSVNKANPYLGEQIVATYKIYTRLNIVDNDVSKLPDFNGFYSKDIDLPPNTTLKNESYNGKMYSAATLKKVVLFPQQSGKIEIDPLELEMIVRVKDKKRPTSFFDQFFGSYKDVKYKAKSNKLTINVKALPEEGKPDGFSGAVGEFSLAATLDKNEVKTNQALNLKVGLSGKGNLHLLESIDVNFPEDFEVYDPKTTDNISITASGTNGKREFEYLVIPRHAGEFNIEPVNFSYFSPAKKQYIELTSGQFDIKVEKGEGDENSNVTYSSANQKEVRMIGRDIRFIKTGEANLQEHGEYFYGSIPFYLSLGLAPILFFLFLFIRRKREKYYSDTITLKSKRATGIAKKRLAVAKKCLAENQSTQFYEEVFKAIYSYVSDKLSIPVSELTKENIAAKLENRNVATDLITRLTDTLTLCEMARFAPISDTTEQQVYDQTVETISQLEKNI